MSQKVSPRLQNTLKLGPNCILIQILWYIVFCNTFIPQPCFKSPRQNQRSTIRVRLNFLRASEASREPWGEPPPPRVFPLLRWCIPWLRGVEGHRKNHMETPSLIFSRFGLSEHQKGNASTIYKCLGAPNGLHVLPFWSRSPQNILSFPFVIARTLKIYC